MARAYEMVFDPETGGAMRADDYLKLCRDAGFDEASAQKMANARANARLDRELPP